MTTLSPPTAPSGGLPTGGPPTVPFGAVSVTRRRRRLSPFVLVSIIVAAAMGALGVVPLVAVAISAISEGQEVLTALAGEDVVGLVRNTLIVVSVSTVFALAIGAALAWVNERTDAGMGIITEAMPLIPFMLPPIAGSIGWVLLLSPTAGFFNGILRWFFGLFGANLEQGPLNIYSWGGLILVYTIYAVPYSFIMCTTGLRSMDPSLEEQSRVSGSSLIRTLRKVTLPAMMPSLLGATMLILMSSFGLFSIPSVIGRGADIPILSTRIVNLLSFTYPAQTGAAIGLSLILVAFVAVFWWVQTATLKKGRFATIGGKGQRATRIRLGKGRPWVRAAVLLYIFFTTVAPILALLVVSLNGFWTLNIDWSGLSLDAFFSALLDDRATRRALGNSLTFGIVGSIIGIAAVALASLWIVRSRSRLARFFDGTIKFPAMLSHLIIAVGFVLAFAGPPFRLGGTAIIMVGAYLALYIPQASVSADTSVAQVGKELPEASRVAGAGESRTIRKIYLPLMTPALILGWAMLFVRMLGDLTASSILAGTRNNVIGFRILEIYQNGSYAELAAVSTFLTALSAVIVIGVLVVSRRLARWNNRSLGGQ
jgi:iron(III) transport system permease protein